MSVDNNPFANLFNQPTPVNVQMPLGGNPLPFNPFMMPPYGFVTPPPPPPPPMFFPQPPVPPPSFNHLSDEELHLLEGTERRNVEERIKVCTTMTSISKPNPQILTKLLLKTFSSYEIYKFW